MNERSGVRERTSARTGMCRWTLTASIGMAAILGTLGILASPDVAVAAPAARRGSFADAETQTGGSPELDRQATPIAPGPVLSP